MEQATLVDGHVHFHSCFDEERFLDAAAANLQTAAIELRLGETIQGVLLFTESARDHHFERLRKLAASPDGARWSFGMTAEDSSLIAQRADGARILIVAGRQIATREGLEVLAVATTSEFDDGGDLAGTMLTVQDSGGIPVIPWGFGKWTFRRRRLVEALVSSRSAGTLFLGDNGGRPTISRAPRLFEVAARRGIWTIPGSDPLPFRSQMSTVGSYGCVLQVAMDDQRPAASIATALKNCVSQPRVFGQRERLHTFCTVQARMQWRKRFGRRI